MVSGAGRNDLALATAGRGDWANKVGADGVRPNWPTARVASGIAAKVSDSNLKALMVAFAACWAKQACLMIRRGGARSWSSCDQIDPWH